MTAPRQPGRFESVSIHANLATDRAEASVSVVSEFWSSARLPGQVTLQIQSMGLPVAEVVDPITLFEGDTSLVQSFRLPRPRLWWPAGYGEQPLYEARVSLQRREGDLLDQRVLTFGIRELRVTPREPDGSHCIPFEAEVNGVPVLLKGWNWHPPSVPPGDYERLLTLVRFSGANLLRVPPGTSVESESFYSLCDRMGILVWQGLPDLTVPQADPPGGAPEMEPVRTMTRETVASRRVHPSLAVWSSAAEPDQPSGGSAAAAITAAVREVMEVEDPDRTWLPDPAPPGPPGPQVDADPAASPELLFGRDLDRTERLRAERYLQAEAARRVVEGGLETAAGCSGVCPAYFAPAETPAVACAVDRTGKPTSLFWSVRRAYRPVHVSAAHPGIDWREQPAFRADVWIHNSGEPVPLLNVAATIYTLDGRVMYQENLAAEAPAGGSENAGDLVWRFPQQFAEPFLLHLEVIDEEGQRLSDNAYLHSRAEAPIFSALSSYAPADVQAERSENLILTNRGKSPALFVEIETENPAAGQPADSWFVLPGGARSELAVPVEARLTLSGWNLQTQVLDPAD